MIEQSTKSSANIFNTPNRSFSGSNSLLLLFTGAGAGAGCGAGGTAVVEAVACPGAVDITDGEGAKLVLW